MKIVDICEFYAPEGGGVRTYIHAKLNAAARAGHDMTIIAPALTDTIQPWPGGGRIISVKCPPLPFDKRYGMFWDAAPVHPLLDRIRPDVLEASSPWRGAWIAASWRGSAVRSLFMHHDPLSAYAYRWFEFIADIPAIDRRFAWFWRYLQRMCAHYDSVICAAPSLSGRLAAGGIGNTLTLPMGVDAGIFSPHLRDENLRASLLAQCNLGPDAVLALGVGRHTPEKRWPVVIDACTQVAAARPLGLVLIGDGHQRGKTLGHIGDNPHVAAMAPVRDRAMLARILASGDMLVHGSSAETFGLVAAEARASGLPLVVPDLGAAADLAAPDHSEIYATGDRQALADAIHRMLARDATTLCTASIVTATGARTLDDHLAELFDHYQTLLDRPERQAA